MRLHIACGKNKQKGFKGVDSVPHEGVDIVLDLAKLPWEPFKDNSIEEIYCAHYCERAPDLVRFMDELWRICQDGATIRILAPYYASIKAWQDPTNLRGISETTFSFFSKKWREANDALHYPIKANFDVVKVLTFMNDPWNAKSEEAKQFAQQHYMNIVSDIYVELKAIK